MKTTWEDNWLDTKEEKKCVHDLDILGAINPQLCLIIVHFWEN